jgi:hypothetical protein
VEVNVMKKLQQVGLVSEPHFEEVLDNVKEDALKAVDSLSKAFQPLMEHYHADGLYHPPIKPVFTRHLPRKSVRASHHQN